ncbi:hypothetical protein LQZ18_06950 [Lachnospiraceae bacterium ZAX-1]
MKTKKRCHFFKCMIFIALCFVLTVVAAPIALPEDVYWHMAKKVIYEMPQLLDNSLDIAAFGGSTCHSFSAMELWNEYGISAYGFGTGNQPKKASYYLLKELLVKQTPSAVLLEVSGTSLEENFRQVFDTMPFTKAKFDGIIDHTKDEDMDPVISYLFPVIKYHLNWKRLVKGSFILDDEAYDLVFRGFETKTGAVGVEYLGITETNADVKELHEQDYEYIMKIIGLCKEKGIKVVLYTTLNYGWDVAAHNAIQKIATAERLEYIDFCLSETMKAAGLNYASDNIDTVHTNTFGGIKQTRYLGRILTQNQAFLDKRGNAAYKELDKDSLYYSHWVEVERLQMENDMKAYLQDMINTANGNDCTIFFSVKDEGVNAFDDELCQKFSQMGFLSDFDRQKNYRHSFIGVKNGGSVMYEKMSQGENNLDDALGFSSYTLDGAQFTVKSAGAECGNNSSVVIDGKEYSKNERGFNVVVYDNVRHKVVDSVNWDTCAEPGLLGKR